MRKRLAGWIFHACGMCIVTSEFVQNSGALHHAIDALTEQMDEATDRIVNLESRVSEFDVKGAEAA